MSSGKVKAILSKYTTWEKLKTLGSNRLLASSSLFLFIVPAIAKLLSEVPDKVLLPLASQEIILNITLPFSWILFFFAALSLLLGNLFFISSAHQ